VSRKLENETLDSDFRFEDEQAPSFWRTELHRFGSTFIDLCLLPLLICRLIPGINRLLPGAPDAADSQLWNGQGKEEGETDPYFCSDNEPYEAPSLWGIAWARLASGFNDLLELPKLMFYFVPEGGQLVRGLGTIWAFLKDLLFRLPFELRRNRTGISLLLAAIAIAFLSFIAFKINDDQFAKIHQQAETEARLGHSENAVVLYENLLNKWADQCDDDIYREYIGVAKQFYANREFESVLSRLAPDSGNSGHPLAHAEIAVRLFSSSESDLSGSQLTQLQHHLTNSADVDLPELHHVRAQFYSTVGNNEKAVEHFRKAAEYKPSYWLPLAKIYQELGKTDRWQESLQAANEAMSKVYSDDSSDERLRLNYAEVLFHLDRLDESEAVLLAGLTDSEKDNDRRATKNALSNLLLIKLRRSGSDDAEMRYDSIKRCLNFNCGNMRAHVAMQQLLGSLEPGEQKERLLAGIISLAENDETGNFAFTLAAIFNSESNFEKALKWSEKALQLDPGSHSKQNQLARLELLVPQGDLTRAAALARSAVEKRPNQSAYRLNLAEILIRMESFEEAVVELKIGLNCSEQEIDISLKRSIHNALIECLNKIGHHDLAQAHVRRLENLH
jgi:tetratricopeptide (TPR) repeat protein